MKDGVRLIFSLIRQQTEMEGGEQGVGGRALRVQSSLVNLTVLSAGKMSGAVESSGLGVTQLCTVVFTLSLRCH